MDSGTSREGMEVEEVVELNIPSNNEGTLDIDMSDIGIVIWIVSIGSTTGNIVRGLLALPFLIPEAETIAFDELEPGSSDTISSLQLDEVSATEEIIDQSHEVLNSEQQNINEFYNYWNVVTDSTPDRLTVPSDTEGTGSASDTHAQMIVGASPTARPPVPRDHNVGEAQGPHREFEQASRPH